MNNELHSFMQQARRKKDEQNQQFDQRSQNQLFQLNQGMNPGPASMFLGAPAPSPSINMNLISNQMATSAMIPSSTPLSANDSQVPPLGISNEIKRLQQLHQLGSAPSPSQRQMTDPSSAMLQNYLDHKVHGAGLDDALRQNLAADSTRRLLMNQNPLTANLLQVQSRVQEMPLPSPHSLFHRDGSRRMRGGVIEPFPEKLHRLLLEVEASGRSDVISFVANGRAFSIHKPDKFFKEIVPFYFRQSRLSSFKRQLNLYGFELINTGPARGGYYHELFVKDRAELCRRMRRVAVKEAAKRDSDTEQADGDHDGDRDGDRGADHDADNGADHDADHDADCDGDHDGDHGDSTSNDIDDFTEKENVESPLTESTVVPLQGA